MPSVTQSCNEKYSAETTPKLIMFSRNIRVIFLESEYITCSTPGRCPEVTFQHAVGKH